MRYIIYCDESDDKGRFYSNFYGGVILRASDREGIADELEAVKQDNNLKGEAKWTKISEYNEEAYRALVDKIFDFVEAGLLKFRIMFTQNIHQTRNAKNHHVENEFFVLYYHFIKLAFGLRYCNPERKNTVHITVFLDDAPDTDEAFANFKDYLSSLSVYPVFRREKIIIDRDDISDVDSSKHVILQAVDIILGSMQFRLNNLHLAKPEGSRKRGKRTRAKERVYKHINGRIRRLYPGFNIGVSTGQGDGPASKWLHPYRHWLFVPTESEIDLTRGKRAG